MTKHIKSVCTCLVMLSVSVSVSVSVLSFVYFFVTSDTLEYSDSQIGV